MAQTQASDDRRMGVTRVVVDGVARDKQAIQLVDDRRYHLVEVILRTQ